MCQILGSNGGYMWYLEKMKALLSEGDLRRLKDIYEPTVVGVQLEDSRKSICVMPDGEIRTYGYVDQSVIAGENVFYDPGAVRCYLSSRNCGLDWSFRYCDSGVMGASARIPWSGRYVTVFSRPDHPVSGTFVHISEIGPDDLSPREYKLCDRVYGDAFQPMAFEDCHRIITTAQYIDPETYNYTPAVFISDDDGESFKIIHLKSTPRHEVKYPDQGPRWNNNGSESTVCKLPDGRLMILARTSLDCLYAYYSSDNGDTWTEGEPSRFHLTNTTPFLLNLSDGRTVLFWNNTRPLAIPDLNKETVPVHKAVFEGRGEFAFTNRDANHAAITSDGESWTGFREMFLNEIRNCADYRVKGGIMSSRDKSSHQFQAIELPYNKVLVAFGQHFIARRMMIFDLDWLYKNENHEDFQIGLKHMTTHMFVKSYSGSYTNKGYAGHCAFNRTDGALLVPDPDYTGAEALQICRVHDKRLLSELQGAVWNFPAAHEGEIRIRLRVVGEGINVRLCDYHMNAGDPHAGYWSNAEFRLDASVLPRNKWCEVRIVYDTSKNICVYNEEELLFECEFKRPTVNGLSYLHLQTAADSEDFEGTLIGRLDFKAL